MIDINQPCGQGHTARSDADVHVGCRPVPRTWACARRSSRAGPGAALTWGQPTCAIRSNRLLLGSGGALAQRTYAPRPSARGQVPRCRREDHARTLSPARQRPLSSPLPTPTTAAFGRTGLPGARSASLACAATRHRPARPAPPSPGVPAGYTRRSRRCNAYASRRRPARAAGRPADELLSARHCGALRGAPLRAPGVRAARAG